MKINALGIGLGIVGQLIIISAFVWLLPTGAFGTESIKWLDFGVLTIIYWAWIANMSFSSMNVDDKTQKGVGGLGIKWYGSYVYSLCALVFGAFSMIYNSGLVIITFKWQLLVQLVLLFFFLVSLFYSLVATKKTEKVYYKEQARKSGKVSVKTALNNLLYAAEKGGASSEIVDRLRQLADDGRFLSPSSAPGARALDADIEKNALRAATAMTSFEMNRTEILELIHNIELDLERRKQTLD